MKLFFKIIFLLSFSLTFAQSPDCSSASAMCSGQGGPYVNTHPGTPGGNQTGYGPITGCGGSNSHGNNGSLGSTPRPAWFTIQIGQSGPINLNLQQFNNSGTGIDVDFALWGPFPNNNLASICNSLSGFPGTTYTGPCNLVDASFSGDFDETIHFPNALAGETYLLLVTNYSTQSGTYSVNQVGVTPSSGQITCDIVCGVNLGPDRILCGSATNVSLTATFLQAPSTPGSPIYSWYLNGVLQFTTPTNTTIVTQNGTWGVSVTRPGCSDIATDDVIVNIIGSVPYNNIGPYSSPAGECNPVFDLSAYLDDLVAPNNPAGFTFIFTDGMTGQVITDLANYTTNDDTTIIVEIFAGSCSEITTFELFVDCVVASCDVDLTSDPATANQTICLNDPISNITYQTAGDATNVTATGLPLGLTAVYNTNILTISGVPTETGTFNYTVETVGCSPNLTLTGVITINPNPTFTSLTANGPICVGADAVFNLSGTPGANVFYTINSNPIQFVTLDTSGNGVIRITGASADVVIILSEIELGTCDINLVNTATVFISPTPAVPAINTTGPTCSVDGFSTITNYDGTLNYTFNPAGPSIGVSGLISGMVLGTPYTITAGNGTCTSLASSPFTSVATLSVPALPVVSITAPTCLADGFATVTNYDATLSYVFTPAGPTVGAGGLVSGMTFGTSYVVAASNGSCSSVDTASFSVDSILPTPVAPIVSETAPTCLADGFSTITNYDGTLNYVFNPAGPTINASGLIQGMVLGTSYSVTSTNASLCTSLVSNNFVNNPMLLTPVVPTISITAPTCLADGFATVTNYDATLSYVFTPAGPTVGAGGLVSGMTFGTSYVVAASNGSCSSVDTASFSVDSILPTPVAPIVSETAPTCLADGFSTITNYDATLNYVFNPAGPTINASGLIQGMVLGTSYSVTSTNASLCTSLVSNNFVNNPMLLTPVVPTISITAPTCLADGFATITNYDATLSYVFTPAGPTVGAGGLVSGMTFGTSYVVAASNGSCSSVDTASFSVDSILPTPVAPIVSETAPTCLADGFSTITNYDGTLNYVFNPAGPTINASGLIQGMVLGTSYSVTSTNASLCTSLVSNNFINNPMLVTPVVPTISITAPTCLADGFATVTNYDATLSYVFTPAGPTVGAGGLVSGMTFGTSYVVAASNGSCSSVDTASFSVDSILPTPVAPIVSETAPTCLADGFSTITNYDGTLNYVFNPAGPTINASGLIQGMVLGTSYSVTSTNASLCTSLVSNNFVNNPMLLTPVVPTISITAPTCLADGFATVTNHDATLSYVFTPAGPTVGAGGLVSGMTFGTSYVVAASNGSCSSVDTASFSVDSILPTPVAPIVSETAPTCLADGFSTITNYDGTLNYVFNPAGPTINASGLIQGMVLGTSYSVTSTNASLCTSLVSNNFVNNPMLLTPVVPTISITAPTCLADGFATVTNYDATLSYVFTPAGPTVGAGGLVSGMTFGSGYVVAASNGSCSSVNTTSFVVTQQLPLPTIVSVTNNGPICLGGTAIFTITATPNSQVIYSVDGNPTQTASINASGVGIVNVTGVTASTTLTTISVFDGICSSNFSLTSTVNLFANTTISLVSNSGTNGQTRCAGVTIDPIQYQVTGTATGVVVTGLPVGVTYDYNVATGLLTIAGATNIAGVYNYSIITSGGCNPQASASGSITITGLPVLSYSVTDTICDGSTLDFVLNSSLPNTTYIWSATVSNISGSYSTTTNGDETNINQIATLTDSENIGTITIVIIPMANGCYGVASNPIVITVNPIPLVESVSVADSSVCSATNTTNNVHVDIVGNISGITYSWTAITSGVNVIGGPTSGTIIATSTTAMIDLQVVTSNPLVAGTIYFEVTPIRNGCPGNLLTSGIVTVNPNPGLPISSPVKTICSGNSTDLMIDVSPLITGTQLTWEVLTVVNVTGATPGTGVAPSPINDVLTATTNTQGYVIYRVRSTLGDCQGGYTDYRVNVNPSPLPILTDGNICITATGEVYQTYTLNTGLNDADYDFEWFDSNGTIIAGATNSTLVVDAAGTYSVIATNWLTGCSSDPLLSSATATVTATTPGTSMTIVQSEYFSENATIKVTVLDGSGTLMYSLDEGALQSSNVFTGVSAGEHIVTVIDTEGCTYMTQEVMVIDYPTYFTPNGDGINDTWNIVGLNQADAKLYIYDRYGKLLKQLSATQDSNGWDGTHNQEQLPSTDYWFTLDYTENGVAKQFKAHFSLNR